MVIVLVAVVLVLLGVLRWADKRDRARGHVNRTGPEARAMIRERRAQKLNKQFLGRRGRGL